MKVDKILPLILLVACQLALTTQAYADTFDDAVNEYIKGFKECSEANHTRTTDLAAAKRKFDLYLTHLRKATSIDESILKSTKRDMETNLRYCERVELNLKRAEAAPLLEKGFAYCENAKQSLINNDIDAASKNLTEYNRYRDDAMIITDSVMEVFALSSKIRACARIEEKIVDAQKQENAILAQIEKAMTDYQSVIDMCTKADKAMSASSFNLNKVDQINQMMNDMAKQKKSARDNSEAFNHLKEQPSHPQSQKLQSLIDTSANCEGQTAEKLRTATKIKRQIEKQIDIGTDTLKRSLQLCETIGSSISNLRDANEISNVESRYNQSAELKRQVVNDTKLIQFAKTYAQWDNSQSFSEMMKATEGCQKSAASSIKEQKVALLQLQQQQTKEDEQAKENARQKQLADEQARIAAEKRRADEQAALAKQKNKIADNLPEVVDDDFVEFDDLEENSKDEKAGKSWTDLIR